jgi:hypothetical protein
LLHLLLVLPELEPELPLDVDEAFDLVDDVSVREEGRLARLALRIWKMQIKIRQRDKESYIYIKKRETV